MPTPRWIAVGTCLAMMVVTASLSAHVRILAPNGGEILRAGTVYKIEWQVVVRHDTQNWDLWYSVTGAGGPWIPIVMDLPKGNLNAGAIHEYSWRVPHVASAFVRIRVRQDNQIRDYEDISDADLAIVPSLRADVGTVSLSRGGTQRLTLDGGIASSGMGYVVAGSATGTTPGFMFGGIHVPLNPGPYFNYALANPLGPILQGGVGRLGGNGQAVARFTISAGFGAGLLGLQLHHVFVAFDAMGQVAVVSNPASVTLVR